MRFRMVIEYNGEGFCGWQRQPQKRTIQGSLEEALFRLCGERTTVFGSGRTDAGVHALGQVAHFDTGKPLTEREIVHGLNHYLPGGITVRSAAQAAPDFHARKHAKSKTYLYVMYESETERALQKGRALRVHPGLDVSAMQRAAAYFLGEHDFKTFMSSGSSAKTSVRTITCSQIICHDDWIVYKVSANGFLYNMVRILTACIKKAGQGKLRPGEIPALIAEKNRLASREMEQPCGLYLYRVEY